jgi:hypothetical protein
MADCSGGSRTGDGNGSAEARESTEEQMVAAEVGSEVDFGGGKLETSPCAPLPSIRGPLSLTAVSRSTCGLSPASSLPSWRTALPLHFFPRQWRASHDDPPPRTWFQHGPASSLPVPPAAELRCAPLLSLHRADVLPPLAPRPHSDGRKREGTTSISADSLKSQSWVHTQEKN